MKKYWGLLPVLAACTGVLIAMNACDGNDDDNAEAAAAGNDAAEAAPNGNAQNPADPSSPAQTNAPAAPMAPTLLTPANGSTLLTGVWQHFDWTDVAGTTSYVVVVTGPNGPYKEQRGTSDMDICYDTVHVGDYTWYVTTGTVFTMGPPSETRTFHVFPKIPLIIP